MSKKRHPGHDEPADRLADHYLSDQADAVRDDKRNTSYFTARVRIREPQALARRRMALTPGMQALVEIVTGRRSVLRYLFDPLIDASRRGFWED